LRLPVASQVMDLEAAPIVAASDEQITLNGAPVGQPGDDGWKFPKLEEDLTVLKNNFKLLHPSEHFHGTVLIAGEETISFSTLRRILTSCAVAGYGDVKLIVRQRG
jgi:hypothetical protein